MSTSIWWFLCGVVVLWVLGAALVIAAAFWELGAGHHDDGPPAHALGAHADVAVETHSWIRVVAAG